MNNLSLTFDKHSLKKQPHQIPACQHDRTGNSQIVSGDTLLDLLWYQVDSSRCGPMKNNFITQYSLSRIQIHFTQETFYRKKPPPK